MARTIIRNISGQTLNLPLPYGGTLPGGGATVVPEDENTVIQYLGGPDQIANIWNIFPTNEATPLGPILLETGALAVSRSLSALTVPLGINGQRLENLGTPVAATDAATKLYVDDLALPAAGAAGNVLTSDGAGVWYSAPAPGGIATIAPGVGIAVDNTDQANPIVSISPSPGASGNVLTSDGAGAWVSAPPAGGGSGTVTSITAGTGLTGGTITTSGTIAADFGSGAGKVCEGNDPRLSDARTPTGSIASGDLAGSTYPNPALAALSPNPQGSYTNASVTVDSKGRVTAASSGSAPVTAVTGSGVISSSGGATPDITFNVSPSVIGNVLTANGSTWVSAPPSGGGGGLVNWAEAQSTSAPNATVPVSSFTPVSLSASNVDAALVPKGNAAVLGQVPDGTDAGGNKRGQYATDWQRVRNNPTYVASGNYATIGGGERNLASGQHATIAGGFNSAANANYATVAGGNSNAATALQAAVLGGNANGASGSSSAIVGGANNQATGNFSAVGGGQFNVASGAYSTIPGGASANTNGILGKYAHSSGSWADSGGLVQRGAMTVQKSTSNAVPTFLTTNWSDAFSGGIRNVDVIASGTRYVMHALVTAKIFATGDTAAWEITAVAKYEGVGPAVIVGTPTVTVLAAEGALTGASITADICTDGTLYAVGLKATGVAGTGIGWAGRIHSVEFKI